MGPSLPTFLFIYYLLPMGTLIAYRHIHKIFNCEKKIFENFWKIQKITKIKRIFFDFPIKPVFKPRFFGSKTGFDRFLSPEMDKKNKSFVMYNNNLWMCLPLVRKV